MTRKKGKRYGRFLGFLGMSTQQNVVSLKNCLEHHLMEIQWFSQKAVQKNCLISSMPRRAKSVALS